MFDGLNECMTKVGGLFEDIHPGVSILRVVFVRVDVAFEVMFQVKSGPVLNDPDAQVDELPPQVPLKIELAMS